MTGHCSVSRWPPDYIRSYSLYPTVYLSPCSVLSHLSQPGATGANSHREAWSSWTNPSKKWWHWTAVLTCSTRLEDDHKLQNMHVTKRTSWQLNLYFKSRSALEILGEPPLLKPLSSASVTKGTPCYPLSKHHVRSLVNLWTYHLLWNVQGDKHTHKFIKHFCF